MAKVTVQYCVNGQYGEMVAKSAEMTEQEMVDEMHRTAKPGLMLRFLGNHGIVIPTGYAGDVRDYIQH